MEQRAVQFFSEGTRIAADIFIPSTLGIGEKGPAVVLCHGFTGVRQLMLADYARLFAEAGYVSLIFDYRGFGGSDGPRGRLIPLEQVDDIRNAVTYLQAQPEVDSDKIGLWGTSFGGAHAPYVAALDPRVKVVVGQVGFDDGARFIMGARTESQRAELLRQLNEDRRMRVVQGAGSLIDPFERALKNPESREFIADALSAFPFMRCLLSWQTWEKTLEYRPIEIVDRIAPRPMLLIAAERDSICPLAGYQNLYAHAGQPKQLIIFPITHYEIYAGQWFRESARHAIQWFDSFLK